MNDPSAAGQYAGVGVSSKDCPLQYTIRNQKISLRQHRPIARISTSNVCTLLEDRSYSMMQNCDSQRGMTETCCQQIDSLIDTESKDYIYIVSRVIRNKLNDISVTAHCTTTITTGTTVCTDTPQCLGWVD